MEFRKKYLFAIPFSALFLILAIDGLVLVRDYSLSGIYGSIFPLVLVIGFWLLEYYKSDEVNTETVTSGEIKRDTLPAWETYVPYIFVLLFYFFIPVFGSMFDYIFAEMLGNDEPGILFLYLSMLFGVIPLSALIMFKLLKIDIAHFKENFYKYLSILLYYSILLFGINILVNIVFILFDLNISGTNEESINESLSTLAPLSKIVFMLYIVIGAPILEESIFRGLPINVYWNKYVNFLAAIAISVLFAFMHYSFSDPISVLVPYIVMSMVFCMSYINSGYNILIPIALHFVNNFSALLL